MMTGLAQDRVILDEVYNETITDIDARRLNSIE